MNTVTDPPGSGITTFAYDQANRLTAYSTTATYAYNGDGLNRRSGSRGGQSAAR